MDSRFFQRPGSRSGNHPFMTISFKESTRHHSGFLTLYQTLLLSAAMLALYINLPIYLYMQSAVFIPKYIYFGLFFLITPLFVVYRGVLGPYLLSPFAVWAVAFMALNFIHLVNFPVEAELAGMLFSNNYGEARQSLIMTRIQYVAFAVSLGFAAYTSPTKKYLHAIVILMVILPLSIMFDFVRPGILYGLDASGAVLGRAAAMFINPTMAGEAVLQVFLLGCAVTAIKYRTPLFLLAGLAVLATFSRSSIIAWLLLLLMLVVRKELPRSAVVVTVIACACALLFLGKFETYLHSRDELEYASDNILSRLNFFSNFSFDDDSSEERADVIRAGWEMFLQNPVFGAGAGATQFWSHRGSTHNQLLLLAAEYGLFGIGAWIWLVVILWRGDFFGDRDLQRAMVFLFVFMSLFTHLMFDSATYWLATFALISAGGNQRLIPSTDGRPRAQA